MSPGDGESEYHFNTQYCFRQYSASAFAANTMIRSGVAAAFPLFTVQMFHNVGSSLWFDFIFTDIPCYQMGTQWAATLLGLIALLLGPSAFLFYKYGAKIRSKSQFSPSFVCSLLCTREISL